MKDSENQVMLTFCLRVTPIVCRRFQYLEMGKWKWVQQKVMDKVFNRNYVSVIIIINFINLRYLWTIPWTSLLLLSSRIFATSPRNSTSLAWSYHCCQHYHCHITSFTFIVSPANISLSLKTKHQARLSVTGQHFAGIKQWPKGLLGRGCLHQLLWKYSPMYLCATPLSL